MVEEKTAIIVIDMLNDFVIEDGSLLVKTASELIPNIKKELKDVRGKGWKVIYLTDSHRRDDPEFSMWPPHAVTGTWGAQVIDELKPEPDDYIIPKRRYSGFRHTQLGLVLRELGVGNVVITGVLTNICVLFTAVEAKDLAYNVTVLKDCVASTTKDDHEWALKQMKMLGIKVE